MSDEDSFKIENGEDGDTPPETKYVQSPQYSPKKQSLTKEEECLQQMPFDIHLNNSEFLDHTKVTQPLQKMVSLETSNYPIKITMKTPRKQLQAKHKSLHHSNFDLISIIDSTVTEPIQQGLDQNKHKSLSSVDQLEHTLKREQTKHLNDFYQNDKEKLYNVQQLFNNNITIQKSIGSIKKILYPNDLRDNQYLKKQSSLNLQGFLRSQSQSIKVENLKLNFVPNKGSFKHLRLNNSIEQSKAQKEHLKSQLRQVKIYDKQMKNFIKDQAKSLHEFRASNSTHLATYNSRDFDPYGVSNQATGFGQVTERSLEQLERNQEKVLEKLKNFKEVPSRKKLQGFKIKSNSRQNQALKEPEAAYIPSASDSNEQSQPKVISQNISNDSSQIYTPINLQAVQLVNLSNMTSSQKLGEQYQVVIPNVIEEYSGEGNNEEKSSVTSKYDKVNEKRLKKAKQYLQPMEQKNLRESLEKLKVLNNTNQSTRRVDKNQNLKIYDSSKGFQIANSNRNLLNQKAMQEMKQSATQFKADQKTSTSPMTQNKNEQTPDQTLKLAPYREFIQSDTEMHAESRFEISPQQNKNVTTEFESSAQTLGDKNLNGPHYSREFSSYQSTKHLVQHSQQNLQKIQQMNIQEPLKPRLEYPKKFNLKNNSKSDKNLFLRKQILAQKSQLKSKKHLKQDKYFENNLPSQTRKPITITLSKSKKSLEVEKKQSSLRRQSDGKQLGQKQMPKIQLHDIINYDEKINQNSHRSNDKTQSKQKVDAYQTQNQTQNIVVPGIVSSMSTAHGEFKQDAQIKVIPKRQIMNENSMKEIFFSDQRKEYYRGVSATQEAFKFQKEGKFQNSIDSNFYSNFMDDKRKTKVEKRYVYDNLETLRSKRRSMLINGSREIEKANMMVVLAQMKHKQRQPRITRQDSDLEPYVNSQSKLSDIKQLINEASLYQTIHEKKQQNRFLQRQTGLNKLTLDSGINKQTFDIKSKSVLQIPRNSEDILNSQSIFKFSRNPELNSRITEDSLYQESPNISLSKTKLKSVVQVSESFQASYNDLKLYTQKSSIQDLSLKVLPKQPSPNKASSSISGLIQQRSKLKLEKERQEVQDSNNILIRKYSDANLKEKLILEGLNEITKKQYFDQNPHLKPFKNPDCSPQKVKKHVKNFQIDRESQSQSMIPERSLFRSKSVHKDEFLDYKRQSSTLKINKKIEELWNEIVQFKDFKIFYPAPQDAGILVQKSALSKYVDIDTIYPEKKQIDFIKVQLYLIERVKYIESGTQDKIEQVDQFRDEVKQKKDGELLDILDKFIFENFERLLKGDQEDTFQSQSVQSKQSSSGSEKSNYFDQENDEVVEKLTKKDFDYFKDDFQHKARRHHIIEQYHKEAATRRDGFSDIKQAKLDELNESIFDTKLGISSQQVLKNRQQPPSDQDNFKDKFLNKYEQMHHEIKEQKLNERFQIIKVTEKILKKYKQNTSVLNSLKNSLQQS